MGHWFFMPRHKNKPQGVEPIIFVRLIILKAVKI